MDVVISDLAAAEYEVEIVEHKGIGHPDTMCDGMAEAFSNALCHHYLEKFGRIAHFNVDKALIVGGAARSKFGGGEVLEPMQVFLAGRATRSLAGVAVDIEAIALGSAKQWIREHMHALDPQRDVSWHCVVGGGSHDLVELFAAGGEMPCANDTSLGVGHAPASVLERIVLSVSDRLVALSAVRPEVGEDTKIMGLRLGRRCTLTVACAFVDRHIASLDDYLSKRAQLKRDLTEVASKVAGASVEIEINAADDASKNRLYLTVTGTSAEAGDDGEVGRGNRVGGLMTPCLPMSLEAAAGKNPVSHVGKIYNVLAQRIAESVVAGVPEVAQAQCFLLSRIGRRIDDPVLVDVRVRGRSGAPVEALFGRIRQVVAAGVAGVRQVSEDIIAARARLF